MDTKKDLETMFRATAKVAEKYNVRLLVIGGGDPGYQKSLETLAEDLAHACTTLEAKGGLHESERQRVKTGTGY